MKTVTKMTRSGERFMCFQESPQRRGDTEINKKPELRIVN